MTLQLYYTHHNPKCHALLPYVPDWVVKIDAERSAFDPPHVPYWRVMDGDTEIANLESMDLNQVKKWFKALNGHTIINDPYANDVNVQAYLSSLSI